MNNWNIRKATVKDVNDVEKCMHLAYLKYKDRLDVEKLPPMHVDYKEEILSYPVWVVEVNNQIAGGIVLVFEQDYASIANIALHPEFQGKGIGKFLMDFAEKEAIRRGYTEINLATHILLTENVEFYKRLGWIQVNQDDTKIYMKKWKI